MGFISDFVAILVRVYDVELIKRGSKTHSRRDVSLVDNTLTNKTVTMTLWGSAADNFAAELYKPIVVRKSTVGIYSEMKLLNANFGTLIWVN